MASEAKISNITACKNVSSKEFEIHFLLGLVHDIPEVFLNIQ